MASRDNRGRAGQPFRRRSRLTTGREYRFVFERPKATQDRYFRVLRRANDRDHCRLGLAVSARACSSAVARNRLKRIIRESFRQHQAQLASRGGWDIVVMPGRESSAADNASLLASLQSHWRKMTKTDPH